ncbi:MULTISPECIES: ATP-binding protein [Streptomyces]|uniref:Anti-sigma regulatory factor (Ser/Thr protein kinase) n=1 Tax=Streptomyces clavifer TaxID=68188 RepID=A0ABS4V1X2_9ACTN|nr:MULTISPECIES: ATP-binding protein [Streptomyces]MBP2357910.1 anti-sigma regulatory factor (Ser/Thr protein kinase) [Streptomyces clavifer]MDX2742418.1 ATP-binding protein [Streptomyces sp. NRRL_B-2557]RPK84285.1 Histidine kinase-, DNA gyrase B-, and HSP90-like ATPase [Streptomyces sp. ADI97-07]WRY85295.1 ATP-binding protein [Streptomyces clavifer]WUC30999.1 ATP-binding protein [Streptomyces clavifer]
MTSRKPLPVRPVRTTRPRFPWHHFTMCFSSTPRGARLARRLAGERLDAWGVPYGGDAHDAVTLTVAELCANAVRHGHVSGRDFRLRLSAEGSAIRVEVTDTRGERLPAAADTASADQESEGGRGLVLVAALADRWGWYPCADGPGKTVWAVLEVVSV